mmetsp:Transcript_16304/g.23998  ORF Transcript_16304/g.23998 Transcript_16304/m.23998 type:complete len:341 (-) Transcript_16304:89-1111(-)
MGNSLRSSSKQQAILLQPAMKGDLDGVKEEVGKFLATYSMPTVGSTEQGSDPNLREFANRQDKDGNNAIHGAVFAGHADVVKYLVESCGASLEISNNLGCSPLWLAAGYNHADILVYIIDKTENPKKALLEANSTGDTPLLAAASRGNLDICRALIEQAKKHNLLEELMSASNHSGDTPLKVAIASDVSGEDVIDLLLVHASEKVVNTPNKKCLTPLLVACERDNDKLARKLLDKKADVNFCDSTGASPLAVASFCGSKDVLKVLVDLKQSNSLEQANNNGCTPLWLAARSGRAEVAAILLESGADPNIRNNDGLSPLDVAAKYERHEVLQLFQKPKATS